jgi:hypothetical protein
MAQNKKDRGDKKLKSTVAFNILYKIRAEQGRDNSYSGLVGVSVFLSINICSRLV